VGGEHPPTVSGMLLGGQGEIGGSFIEAGECRASESKGGRKNE